MSTSTSMTTVTESHHYNHNQSSIMTALNNNNSNSTSTSGEAAANLISMSTQIQQFEVIRKWLAKNHKKYYDPDQATNKQLAHFLAQFIQFQEDNLGRNATKPLPNLTRLPVSFLFKTLLICLLVEGF